MREFINIVTESEAAGPLKLYHITDKANFKLSANHAPSDNAISITDRSGHKGIYLATKDGVEKWVNGHGYIRLFVAEIAVEQSALEHDQVSRRNGEVFVPADQFGKLNVLRVVPLDAICRWSEFTPLSEGAFIAGLKSRFEDLELDKDDLCRFASNRATPEEFASYLADPGTPAYDKLIQFYTEYKDGNIVAAEQTKFHIPYVGQLIAKQLDATGYKNIVPGTNLPWPSASLMGGRGYIIDCSAGKVFMDATLENKNIYLSQIATEQQGAGLGTKVMEILKQLCDEHDWGLIIYKVTNPKFYARFSWLKKTKNESYYYGNVRN